MTEFDQPADLSPDELRAIAFSMRNNSAIGYDVPNHIEIASKCEFWARFLDGIDAREKRHHAISDAIEVAKIGSPDSAELRTFEKHLKDLGYVVVKEDEIAVKLTTSTEHVRNAINKVCDSIQHTKGAQEHTQCAIDRVRGVITNTNGIIAILDEAAAQAWGALSWIINYDSEDKTLQRAIDTIEAARKKAGIFDYDAMRDEIEVKRDAILAGEIGGCLDANDSPALLNNAA